MSWELVALTALMREHLQSLRGESEVSGIKFPSDSGRLYRQPLTRTVAQGGESWRNL